jgi:FtsP/CotA-like multicopper oxidase with cupredoxin domain
VTYFYRPHREGTYMYHCHFEDVEHVQMGMTGIVFVRPLQDQDTGVLPAFAAGHTDPWGRVLATTVPPGKYAYNDYDGSTAYDRHFSILLNEIWYTVHDGDRDIQEVIETSYDPQYFTLNGRVYPQTALVNDVPSVNPWPLPIGPASSSGLTTPNFNYDNAPDISQPNSSLIQCNPGERVLLRLADLGYRQHAMQLPGIKMHVVGQDASLLRNGGVGGVDTSYFTDTLYLGPGEARDVLFDAPAYSALSPGGNDTSLGPYNVYYFRNRDWRKLSNNGAPGLGGMMTEVRVYQNPLPAQTVASQTYV